MGRTAGRISDADKERVRDATRIEAVIGDYVALKRAGAGNLKGLCPFHDEKTPSFTVSTARGFYHCFGCGEGGDVFTFLMKIDGMSFVEAVQYLADRTGITLTYRAGEDADRGERTSRSRLTAITKAAAAFYADNLRGNDAQAARTYLADRGFDAAAAAHFGCGFAPAGWDALIKHLAKQRFSIEDMIAAGVAKRGQRGPIDAFHRRLTWAIRDAAGDVVGFGARRLFADDRLEAKYINTSGDGRLYRKSQVLYGLDLAKRDIVKQRQVVVVEGYTDVMAMHLAGVTTAVAACGTAFGDEHIDVLRRYLMDSELMRGEVIYVFDGDAAGQSAARKAFDSDQRFAANTFVAIAPDGMDPCELRQEKGDAAVRELTRSKTPLFRFAIAQTLADYDLETVEGRTGALTAAVPMVARIKDDAARAGYERELAERVGVNPGEVTKRVRGARRQAASRPHGRQHSPRPSHRADDHARQDHPGRQDGSAQQGRQPGGDAATGVISDRSPQGSASAAGVTHRTPDPNDRATAVEREALKLALQVPSLVAPGYGQIERASYSEPAYASLHDAITAAGGPAAATASGAAWVSAVTEHLPPGPLTSLVTELAVEPVRDRAAEPEPRYAGAILARMAERRAAEQERELASALRRAEAVGDKQRMTALSADLGRVMTYRRALADRARGAEAV